MSSRYVSKNAPYLTIFTYEYIGVGIGGLLLQFLPSVNKNIKKDIKSLKQNGVFFLGDKATELVAQMAEGYAVTLVAVPLVNIIGGIQPMILLIFGLLLTTFFPHFIKENIHK